MSLARTVALFAVGLTFAPLAALAQDSTPPTSEVPNPLDKAAVEITDGLRNAAKDGAKLLEGLVGGLLNPTQSRFRSAVAEGRLDEAQKIYEANAEALRKDKGLDKEIEATRNHARAKAAPGLIAATAAVEAARADRLFLRDPVDYLKLLGALSDAKKSYLLASVAISDFKQEDALLKSADDSDRVARAELQRDIAIVYRQFPHERMAFSSVVDSPANERELFAGAWEQLSQRVSELKPLEAQQLLRNTASAWGPDSELRGKVGASVWQKIAPAQANPVQSLRAVGEIAEYGITPSDVKAYPRLLVATSLPTGTELGVNFTTGHDASLPSVEAFAAAPAGGPAVLVEVQSTASRRQIVDKKEESSEYKSGTRAVPNPQYAIAQMNCQRAQSELAAQQTRNAIAPARGWGILLQGIVEGLSQASVTTVCNEFAATSASLQEDVFTPYSYTVSEIEVIRSAQGRIVSVDSARGIVDTYPLAIEDKARHHVAYGRKSTDRGLSSKSITDAELETLASKPLAIDAKAVVLALNEESKKTYTQAELPTILAQRPAEPTTIRPTLLANTGPAPDRPPPGPTATTSQPSRHAAYTPAALQPQAPEAANLDARMGSVVVVLNPKGMIGAGFYVDSNEILTNYHVVEGASTIELRALDSQLFTGRVIKKDIGLDLALIKVERVGQPLAFSQAIVKAGDTVEAVGHPKGLFFSVSRGIVSAVRQMKGALAQGGDKALVIQTDTPINPGNSGGPLFLKDRVIGINTLKFRNSEGIGFAVHYAEVVKFLSQQ